jgi:hypothetical protein
VKRRELRETPGASTQTHDMCVDTGPTPAETRDGGEESRWAAYGAGMKTRSESFTVPERSGEVTIGHSASPSWAEPEITRRSCL